MISVAGYSYPVDVDIDAPEAWAVLNSAYSNTLSSTVGVIDSGLSERGTFDSVTGYIPGHEDISGALLFVNSGEFGGIAGSDDDLNGYLDDINGWDWYTTDDAFLPGNEPDDDILGEDPVPADSYSVSALTRTDPTDHWHGTLVSGVFAAGWNNGQGIGGLSQNRLDVLPLRTYLGEGGIGDVLSAIDYAAVLASKAAQGMVLNASWRIVGSSPSKALKDSIEFAAGKGILFVAAAGNNSSDNDQLPVYPASYSVDTDLNGAVLSVGATDFRGRQSSFSNYGENSVQIMAPGSYLLSTYKGDDSYAFASGTSFSSPLVAGAAGILMGAHPSMSTSQVIERLVEGGRFDERLAGLTFEGKRLNLAGALAPFHPFSKLAFMDTIYPVVMYSDHISSQYGSIDSATSGDPSVAVLHRGAMGSWALSPVAPGITSFDLTFTSGSAPVAQYRTGPWRVTALSPFRVFTLRKDQTVTFDTVGTIPGTISWSVENTSVGSISSSGVFTAKNAGETRIILLVDGAPYDTSASIQVLSSVSGGGCGTTAPPDTFPWSGVTEVVSVLTLLLLMRWRAAPHLKSGI
jgi:hypothetical protein